MTQWFTESFRAEFDKQAMQLGRFNLALFGKTGVGKSTLVNAVFGADVAATGVGAPVTLTSHLYMDTRGSLGVIDTRGLEIGKDDKQLLDELSKVVKQMRKRRIDEQIHVAWYCIRGLDRRFEDAEADFIKKLHKLSIPIILVMTQVPMRDGVFHPDAVTLARQIGQRGLPIVGDRVFMTFAMRDQFTGQSPYGLMELLQATFRVAPEAVHGALAAAQTIDLAAKARAARTHITATVAASAAAAASPIPFSDAAVLVPLQLAMMGRIAHLYNIRFERAALLAIASTSAATNLGRSAVASLIKLIPGAGTVAGGMINAGVASTFTYAMGEAWLAVCQRAFSGKLPMLNGVVDSAAVRDLFMREFSKRMPSMRQQGSPQPGDIPG